MATLFSNSEWSVDKISTIPLFKLIYTSTFIRCWIAGSARMFLSDFACSSKIRPAVLGSSKELTTSSIAIKRSITCNQQKLYTCNTCKYIAAHIQAPHIKVRRDMWWWAHVLNPYFDFHNILPDGYIGYIYVYWFWLFMVLSIVSVHANCPPGGPPLNVNFLPQLFYHGLYQNIESFYQIRIIIEMPFY